MSIASKGRKAATPATTAATPVKSNGPAVDHMASIVSLVMTKDTTSGQEFCHHVCMAALAIAATTDGKWKKPLADITARRINDDLKARGSLATISANSLRKYYTQSTTLMDAKHKAHIPGLAEAAATNDPEKVMEVFTKSFNVEAAKFGHAMISAHIEKNTAGRDGDDSPTPIADRMLRNLKSSDATLSDVLEMLAIGKVKGSKVLGTKDEGGSLLLAVIRAYQDKKSRKGLTKASLKAMNDLEKAAKA